jgi:quinol-cytochrome oxidoreductase complex cytochrome b subunit
VLPQGIPGFVLMLLVGGWSAGLVEAWLGTSPDYAQMSFVALAAPYTLLALLALVGREGAEGEERWVQAPERRSLQRIGGVLMLAALIRLHLG